jgi:iron(III) transport system substrate-binding protein
MRGLLRPRAASASGRVAASLLVVLVLGACGSSPTAENDSGRKPGKELKAVLRAVNGLQPREREAKLAQLAKREGGELTLYHTLNQRSMGPLIKQFNDKYDIEVGNFETNAADLLQRISEESRAGIRGVDLVETGGPEMYAMANDGVFADYRSPYQARLGRGSIRKGWTADRYSNYTVAWNTKRVKPGEQPRSWEELARPKWRGRISIAAGTVGVSWYKTLRDYWVGTGRKSAAEADRVFQGIARNARALAETNETLELLAAGEFDVAVAIGTGNVDALKAEGAPLAWKPAVQPIVRLRAGAGLVRDARHPAAATLFLDYLISDGQDVLAATHRDPARKDLETAPRAKLIVVDLEKLAPEQKKWTDRWDRIVGLAHNGKGG